MADKKDPVCVRYVCVNRLPDFCGECPLLDMTYNSCLGINKDKNGIEGNPSAMTYRRSDCPLMVEEKC